MWNSHYSIKVEILFEIWSVKMDRNEAIDKVQDLLKDLDEAKIELIQIISTPDVKKSLSVW